MVAALIILGSTIGGIVAGGLIGSLLGSLAIRLNAQRLEKGITPESEYLGRNLAGGWVVAGLLSGLALGLAISFDASFWTWLLFLPVGRITDELHFTFRFAFTGRYPPLGWGVVATIWFPIIGGLLWLLGVWPFT